MEFKTFRRTLLIAAVLFVPAGTSMAANLYAFGGRDIAVPSILPEGNVTSRYTFTPCNCAASPAAISSASLCTTREVSGTRSMVRT